MNRSIRLKHTALFSAVLACMTPAAHAAAYVWNGGSYSAAGLPSSLSASDTLNILGSAGSPIFDINLANAGVVDMNTAALYGNGITLTNSGAFKLDIDGNLNATGSNWIFVNSGTLSKVGGTGTSTFNGGIAFTNNGGTINASTGSIVFANGASTFNASTTFAGAGTTLVNSAAAFNDNFSVASGATLNLQGATFTGASSSNAPAGVTLNGTANLLGGTMTGTWTVAAGSTLNAQSTGAGGSVVIAGVLNNKGAVNVASDFYGNGVTLNNTGTFNLTTNNSLLATGSNWTFNNNGSLQKTGSGTSTISAGIAFVNNGVAINIAAGNTLNWANGNTNFNGGTAFQNGGTALVSSNALFFDTQTVASGTTLNLQSGVYTGGSSGTPAAGAVLKGIANFNGGTLNGVWTVAAGSTLNTTPTSAGGNVTVAGALNNIGTTSVAGNFYGNGLTLNNTGTFNLTTNDSLLATGSNWTFNNSGSLQKTGGGTSTIGAGVAFVNNGVAINIAAGNTLNWANGNTNFNGGTAFQNGGTALVSSNALFFDTQTVASGTTLNLQGGVYTGGTNNAATAGSVLKGIANFNGGTMNGVWTVAAGSTLNTTPTGPGGSVVVAGTLNNIGTTSVAGNFYGNGLTLNNTGTFNLTTNDSLLATGSNWTFNNSGSLQKTGAGTSTIGAGVAFVNNGVAINIASGNTLNWAGGSTAFNGGTRFTGGGTALVTGSANFNDAVSVASGTTLALTGANYAGGTTTSSTAGAVLTGAANFNGGQLTGTWTVASGGVLNTQPTGPGGSAIIATSTFTNNGRVNVAGDLYGNGATVNNNAGGVVALTTDSSLLATGSNWTFANAGTVLKTGTQGTSTIGNGIGFTNLAGGVVRVDSGIVNFQGSFSNAGTLLFGIAGPGSNGAINLSTSTLLGGSFAATLLAGFVPVVGQTFDVMNFASGYTGSFANTAYTVGGVTFSAVYKTNEFDLTITNIAAVPEPSTWALSLVGLLMMGAFKARSRRQ